MAVMVTAARPRGKRKVSHNGRGRERSLDPEPIRNRNGMPGPVSPNRVKGA
jgi:hypothetical protein